MDNLQVRLASTEAMIDQTLDNAMLVNNIIPIEDDLSIIDIEDIEVGI